MQKIRPDMDIGQNIQKERYRCGFTQDQVVAKLNLKDIQITKSTYAKLETNRMNIKVSDCLHCLRSSSVLLKISLQDYSKISFSS